MKRVNLSLTDLPLNHNCTMFIASKHRHIARILSNFHLVNLTGYHIYIKVSALPYDIYATENYIIIRHICQHTERQITDCPLEQRKFTWVCCYEDTKAVVWLLTSKVVTSYFQFSFARATNKSQIHIHTYNKNKCFDMKDILYSKKFYWLLYIKHFKEIH